MFWSLLRSFLKGWFFPNRRGYSLRGFWGEIKHYNKYGVQIGYSLKSFWGGRKRYDMTGKLISYTLRNFWGGYDTYDANGNLIRKSYRNFWGGYTTYNRAGKMIMESYRSFWGGMNHFDVEDSDSTETYVFEKHSKAKKIQNTSARTVSDHVVQRGSSQKQSISVPKTDYEKARTTTRPQTKKHKEEQLKSSALSIVTPSSNTRHIGTGGGVTTAEYVVSKKNEKADLSQLFQQHIDKTIPFYESLSELNEEQMSYGEGVKILAFSYGDLKEFPAYVQPIGNKLSISPLIRNVQSFIIEKNEISEANKETVDGLEMNIVDNEFASFCASKIVNDFGDLFPEYEYQNDGMARAQYVLKCGLVITENSWLKLMERFSE